MGRLIPAGTGLPMYRNIEVESTIAEEVMIPIETVEEEVEETVDS